MRCNEVLCVLCSDVLLLSVVRYKPNSCILYFHFTAPLLRLIRGYYYSQFLLFVYYYLLPTHTHMSVVEGIVAALLAPLLVVIGFLVWDNEWKASAFSLNLFKCSLTSLGFLVMVIVTTTTTATSSIWNTASWNVLGALMLSSTIGILIGDWVWLEGMRILGARKIIAVDSFKPFLAAGMGHVVFGESITIGVLVGLSITIVGVSIVALERADPSPAATTHHVPVVIDQDIPVTASAAAAETDHLLRMGTVVDNNDNNNNFSYSESRKSRIQPPSEITYGIVMAVLNVVLHTCGATLTKLYGVHLSTFEINLVRFGFAALVMGLVSIGMSSIFHYYPPGDITITTTAELPWYKLPPIKSLSTYSWSRIMLGVLFVSFLQPSLTNYSMFQISLALLLTLESIGPLYALPLAWLLQGERPTWVALVGAILAVAGIGVLSLSETKHSA